MRQPPRYAYADPPYPGQARRHYRNDPSRIPAAEVDHAELIARLVTYDGWALSTSSTALRDVLPLCPSHARVAAWVKPFAIYKPGVNPGYTWEPVIFVPGRKKRSRDELTVRDHLAANVTLRKGVHGAKPEAFCWWLFDLLGMQPGDEIDDLFPGTGIVSQTWAKMQSQLWTALWTPQRDREAQASNPLAIASLKDKLAIAS